MFILLKFYIIMLIEGENVNKKLRDSGLNTIHSSSNHDQIALVYGLSMSKHWVIIDSSIVVDVSF